MPWRFAWPLAAQCNGAWKTAADWNDDLSIPFLEIISQTLLENLENQFIWFSSTRLRAHFQNVNGSWRKALRPTGAGRARCAQDTVGWHGQLNTSQGEQLCSSNLGTGILSPSPDAFRGLTFSQSDIGTISSFRPTARPAAWSEGVKHDAPDNLCVSHAVLFTSENSSDSCGGSSVCFPGVSSSSGTNDLLFPVLSASLVTDRWARFPELWDSNVIWVALVAGGAGGEQSRAGAVNTVRTKIKSLCSWAHSAAFPAYLQFAAGCFTSSGEQWLQEQCWQKRQI